MKLVSAKSILLLSIISHTLNLLTNPWPAARNLFWISIPMKNRVPTAAFIKNPATRAIILFNHARLCVDNLIREMPNGFERTLSAEDRYSEDILIREKTRKNYLELISSADNINPIIEYITNLTARTHNQHPTLTIQPKIFLTSPTHPIRSAFLETAGPDIIINYQKFMSLNNWARAHKLTKEQQFLLNTTGQSLLYGDQYLNIRLKQTLALPAFREKIAAITIAQKLRNDLAAANTTALDNSGNLMSAGIHFLNRLAHQKYHTPEAQTRLKSLIKARNLIENSDRRN